MPEISLYNTLSRRKEQFHPLDPNHVKMYVCGPTVYDRAHLGNARSVVVYDVLYRLMKQLYPQVTYVRNITDVDDKINKAAKDNGEPISTLTQRVTGWFHEDMAALNCLPPTREPRATEHIPQMIAMIEKLIKNGNAYVAQGHVLFAVKTMKDYGKLSGRVQEELESGARVKVESYKRDPNDFVLWKPADAEDDPSSVFDSPWGKGRPGWHIECSAMATEYLGETFDIHGGGADLMFPHHENEIAQSCCANPGSQFAKLWVHNGFLTVNGEKMSKSLGNFITVNQLLNPNANDPATTFLTHAERSNENIQRLEQVLALSNVFPKHWGKEVVGQALRLCLLSTHYRSPLDFSLKKLEDAVSAIKRFYNCFGNSLPELHTGNIRPSTEFISALCDDLNISEAINLLHHLTTQTNKAADDTEKRIKAATLLANGRLLGLFSENISLDEVSGKGEETGGWTGEKESIQSQIDARNEAKKAKNWKEADRIRDELKAQGILLEDGPGGTTWRRA